MSNTVTQTNTGRGQDPGHSSEAFTPPPKLRRRPGLTAAAVAAIFLGGAIGAWAWTSTTNTTEVLAARTTIERGSVIVADDLVRVRVSSDPALMPVAGDQLDVVVGQRAAVDIAQGTLVSRSSFTDDVTPAADTSLVGVSLAPGQVPGTELAAGDRVRVVVTPAQGGDAPTETPAVSTAEVAGTYLSEETGQLVVDLLVPHTDAALVAARAATGNVALVLDSRER